MRLLTVLRLGHDFITHLAEHHADLRVSIGQAVDERAGKWAVTAFAVERDIAGLGGIDDQRSLSRRRCGEPSFAHVVGRRHDDTGCRRLRVEFGLFGEGIVATRIENDDAQLTRAAYGGQQAVEGERLLADLLQSLQGDIDRDQKVFATDLDAVTCIINHGDIGGFRTEGEIVDCLDETGKRLVYRLRDVEADGFESGGDTLRIIAGIFEWYDIAIGRHADHERHAAGGLCGDAKRQGEDENDAPNHSTDHPNCRHAQNPAPDGYRRSQDINGQWQSFIRRETGPENIASRPLQRYWHVRPEVDEERFSR